MASFGLIELGLVITLLLAAGIGVLLHRPRYHLVEVEKATNMVAYWNEQFQDEFQNHPVIDGFRVSADDEGRIRIKFWNHKGESAAVDMERFIYDAAGAICEATHYLEGIVS